ncbi:MAG TPA: alpha/beta hydrolase [Bacteroidales bacterium]|nr:alpha/beta hydrolase [Bacteroidales bacterium]
MQYSSTFRPDTELSGFESVTIDMGTDYEGPVVCTLTRKISAERPTVALLHVHGFNDYFFHAEAAGFFLENGVDYYGLDLRKSGRSWREHQKYNNLRDIEEYFEDISAAIGFIRNQGIEKILLMGHSMGGLVSACYCSKSDHDAMPDALFLNSPFLEQNKDIVTRKLLIPLVARIGSRYPGLLVPGGFSSFYGPSLHSSANGEWNYNLHFKPHRSKMVNAGWVRAIYHAQRQISNGVHIPIPLLLMFPDKSVSGLWWSGKFHFGDAVVNVKHIRSLQTKINSAVKTVQEVQNAKHDLFLSTKKVRDEVYKFVLDWSIKHLNS